MFTPFGRAFNQRSTYSKDVTDIFSFELGKNKELSSRYPYLMSHISNDRGVVEFRTKLDSATLDVLAEIVFVDTITTIDNIKNALLQDSLSITYSTGKKEMIKNMFDFSGQLNNNLDN